MIGQGRQGSACKRAAVTVLSRLETSVEKLCRDTNFGAKPPTAVKLYIDGEERFFAKGKFCPRLRNEVKTAGAVILSVLRGATLIS